MQNVARLFGHYDPVIFQYLEVYSDIADHQYNFHALENVSTQKGNIQMAQ
jgi:hypothetical protein